MNLNLKGSANLFLFQYSVLEKEYKYYAFLLNSSLYTTGS
uniref:Uncharacterized protein n=1 Tax=Anguilla anguilla TaxID=7936 RepID=A0A0E9PGC9_ANGAN